MPDAQGTGSISECTGVEIPCSILLRNAQGLLKQRELWHQSQLCGCQYDGCYRFNLKITGDCQCLFLFWPSSGWHREDLRELRVKGLAAAGLAQVTIHGLASSHCKWKIKQEFTLLTLVDFSTDVALPRPAVSSSSLVDEK